jgi:hypothetical protein
VSNIAPITKFLGNDKAICQNFPVTLKPNFKGASVSWSTGVTADSINVTAPGQYIATSTSLSGCVNKDTIEVVNFANLPALLGADIQLCRGGVVTVRTAISAPTYSWNTGQTSDSLRISAAGQYILMVSSANGCSKSDTINVTEIAPFTNLLGADRAICTNETAVLKSRLAGYNFRWSSGQITDSITVNTAGRYIVNFKTVGGCDQVDTIDVVQLSATTDLLGANQNICAGKTTTLKALVVGTSINWSTGATSDSIVIASPGKYWVRLNTTTGCTISDTIVVNIVNPTYGWLGADQTLCQGDSIELKATGLPQITWNNGTITSSLQVKTTGQYIGYYTNPTGCLERDTINITFNGAITETLPTSIATCNVAQEIIAAPAFFTYLWNTGATTQTIKPGNYGRYSVTLTNSVCSKVTSTELKEGDCSWFIPNFLSLNGDNLNDELRPSKPGIFSSLTMAIYNRYGVKVADISDPEIRWNANDVSGGVYYYTLEGTIATTGEKVSKKGWIEISK